MPQGSGGLPHPGMELVGLETPSIGLHTATGFLAEFMDATEAAFRTGQ